jgi:hypothetical protein
MLAVLMFHVAVIAALLLSFKTRIKFSAERSMELVILRPRSIPNDRLPTPNAVTTKKTFRPQNVPLPEQSLSVVEVPSTGEEGPRIDWAGQAHAVAAESADRGRAPRAIDVAPKSSFALAPAHHAGEEFTTPEGRAVFINDHCYQVSKTFSDTPNGISNGMGAQTYCTSPSNKPRGDLFDQLPAYKKLHPDP